MCTKRGKTTGDDFATLREAHKNTDDFAVLRKALEGLQPEGKNTFFPSRFPTGAFFGD